MVVELPSLSNGAKQAYLGNGGIVRDDLQNCRDRCFSGLLP
jgi:hypothetical protein